MLHQVGTWSQQDGGNMGNVYVFPVVVFVVAPVEIWRQHNQTGMVLQGSSVH